MNHQKGGYHHGALREALIDRAMEELAAGTPATKLSVRNLATELGVSPGAPYRHFPTADALIAAIAARGFADLYAAMATVSPATLASIGISYVRFAAARPELYRAMYHFPAERLADYPDLASAADRAFGLLRDTVETHPSPEVPVTAAWAYVHGLSGLLINRLTDAIDVDDDESMRALMNALAG